MHGGLFVPPTSRMLLLSLVGPLASVRPARVEPSVEGPVLFLLFAQSAEVDPVDLLLCDLHVTYNATFFESQNDHDKKPLPL